MKLQFLGTARDVTGPCCLIESGGVHFLVDGGLFQGGRTTAARNREPYPLDPASIDFVLLTHGHIDHSGLLPKLTRAGFSGPIYTTHATADLLDVMLPDSAHIQEEDAKRQQRHGRKNAHHCKRLLYTERIQWRSRWPLPLRQRKIGTLQFRSANSRSMCHKSALNESPNQS